MLWVLATAIVSVPIDISLAESFYNIEARGAQVPIFSDDSSSLLAVLKIERLFTDRRRMGFFQVRLLPIRVAQGVSLEFKEVKADTNWVGAFHFKAPFAQVAEWRDVSVKMPDDATPRFHAQRLYAPKSADADFWLLENVSLQTAAGPVAIPKARLLKTGAPGRVIWESGGSECQWDLFSRKVQTATTQQQKVIHENSLDGLDGHGADGS